MELTVDQIATTEAEAAGATSELGIRRFLNYLKDDSVCGAVVDLIKLPQPLGKDQKRIYDIVEKANRGCPGCMGMVTTNRFKMIELATLMNKKITDEDKRARRKDACLAYGLKFLARCFEKSIA